MCRGGFVSFLLLGLIVCQRMYRLDTSLGGWRTAASVKPTTDPDVLTIG